MILNNQVSLLENIVFDLIFEISNYKLFKLLDEDSNFTYQTIFVEIEYFILKFFEI